MTSFKWWCAGWACWLSQAACAVGITPQMLDVERNPVASIAAAQTALAALPTLGLEAEQKRLEWLLQATFAAAMLGDQTAYAQFAAQAETLGVRLNDPYAKALLKALSAGKAGENGKPQEAAAGAREAVQLAEAVSDPLSRAFVRDMIGWALMIGRQFGEAEGHLRAAIEAYVAHDAVLRRAAAQAGMGQLFEGLRDVRSAYRERQAAYDLIRDLDAPYLKSYVTWSLGKDALVSGEAQKAKGHFETSVRESTRMNDRAGVGSAAEQGIGLAAADLGQWQQALKVLEAVQPRMLSKGYIPLWVVGQAALARAQVELGRGDGEAVAGARAPKAPGAG
jgi:tetratricopeptide (TPR) repeat protein